MFKKIFSIIDFLVIVIQLSINISIVPYIILGSFQSNNFIYLIIGLGTLAILLIRFKGKIYPFMALLRFPPMTFFFLLLFFQLISFVVELDFYHFGAVIVITFNQVVFLMYINNLFLAKRNSIDVIASFTNLNLYYVNFALFNVFAVLISILLQLFKIIKPFTNNINDLFPSLLSSNTMSGQHYYMPGWISLQTGESRLGFVFGNLTGWTHEPHVLGYLIFPSLFFLLAKYTNRLNLFIIIIVLFTIVGLISFSVTSFSCLLIIMFFKLLSDKKYITGSIVFLLIFIYSIIILNRDLGETILSYTSDKYTYNTSSAEYSGNKIMNIVIPNSIFGNGILLISEKPDKNAGSFAAIFYLAFYSSLLFKTMQIIFSNNKRNVYYGFAFLYFILHSLKLSSSIFVMPYTIYFLGLMAIYNKYYLKAKTIDTVLSI
ncbi:MAG: hypothetical protein A2W85_09860 [Bacteroidetes bacterium GWF2_41_31]|nr:MAG: hypothetical protein A2W85_09860 [Bacteroidetes bacterium GWF2_41_31]